MLLTAGVVAGALTGGAQVVAGDDAAGAAPVALALPCSAADVLPVGVAGIDEFDAVR